jgi:hypothetical protein
LSRKPLFDYTGCHADVLVTATHDPYSLLHHELAAAAVVKDPEPACLELPKLPLEFD